MFLKKGSDDYLCEIKIIIGGSHEGDNSLESSFDPNIENIIVNNDEKVFTYLNPHTTKNMMNVPNQL